MARIAMDGHVAYMKEAVDGHGCDRHMMGLRKMINDDESMPALFTDASYSKTSHWNLSTSQLTSEHFDGYGWGEVVPDGYGVAYMVKNNQLHFNVVAQKHMQPKELAQCIEYACSEMAAIFSMQPKL